MVDNHEQPVDFGYERVSPNVKTQRVREVFDTVAPRYDVMNDLMSLGLHRIWKRLAVMATFVKPGHRVLDLAGGTGDLTRHFAKRVGAHGEVVLSDINGEMLAVGRDRTIDEGLDANVCAVQANAECLPFDDRHFDVVSIAFGLRNVTDKLCALKEMFRVLRPGGRLMVLEFSELKLRALTPVYDAYSFKLLPRVGKLVARDDASYRYLAESIRMHPNQASLADMIGQAGFERVRYRNIAGGIAAIHDGMRL